MIHIEYIKHQHINTIWYDVAPLLSKAIDNYSIGEYTIEDIFKQLKNNESKLSIVLDDEVTTNPIIAAVVTDVISFPQQKHLRLTILGGERMSEWMDRLFEHMEIGAKNVGASHISVTGRPGWAKLLAKWANHKQVTLTHAVE